MEAPRSLRKLYVAPDSRNLEVLVDTGVLEFGIQNSARQEIWIPRTLTKNPESTAWNLESTSGLNYFTWEEL